MTFQSIVLISATVILIILLVIVAYLLQNQKIKNAIETQNISNCPDFWKERIYNEFDDGNNEEKELETNVERTSKTLNEDSNGNSEPYPMGQNMCLNTNNIGNPIVEFMDFNDEKFTGEKGICEKQAWAKSHQLTWDGITNRHLEQC